jgi:hypothetical protein
MAMVPVQANTETQGLGIGQIDVLDSVVAVPLAQAGLISLLAFSSWATGNGYPAGAIVSVGPSYYLATVAIPGTVGNPANDTSGQWRVINQPISLVIPHGIIPVVTLDGPLQTVAPPAASGALPAVIINPAIVGSGTVGSLLIVTNGQWTNTPGDYGFQWLRNGQVIPGQTNDYYTTVNADLGTTLTVVVNAINNNGSSQATTAGLVVTGAAAGVPGVPTGVTAAAGLNQATVLFTAPASTGGAPVNGYVVSASTGQTVTGASSPIVVTGLAAGVAVTFTVRASNSAGIGGASAPSSAIVPTGTASPVFTAASPPAGSVGQFYSYTFAASGFPAPTFALASGSFPVGLTLNGTTGVLSGTPTTTATSTFAVSATNTSGPPVTSSTVSVVIGTGPPVLSFTTLTVNSLVSTTTGTFTNSPTSFNYAWNRNGSPIGGADGTSNPYTVQTADLGTTLTVTVTAVSVANGNQTATSAGVLIPSAPVFTADTPTSTATVGQAYSYTYTATGMPAPTFALASGSFPAGVTLNATTGVLSGTPSATSLYTFTVSATNAGGTVVSGTSNITVTAGTTPAFTASSPALTATVGLAYTYTFTASGTPAPVFSVSSGSAPPGLTLNPTTGVLAGVPTTPLTATFSVAATNAAGAVTAGPFSIVVSAQAPTVGVPVIGSAPVITGMASQGNVLSATDGTWTNTPASWSFQWNRNGSPISGATGTVTTGTITYTVQPADVGTTVTVSVQAINSTGTSIASTSAGVVIAGASATAPLFTNDAPGGGTVGVPYSYDFNASGTPAPTFAVTSGTLPAGVTINATTGVISGTPTTAQTATFVITASNSAGSVPTPSLNVVVAAPVVGVPALNIGHAGQALANYPFLEAITGVNYPALHVFAASYSSWADFTTASTNLAFLNTPGDRYDQWVAAGSGLNLLVSAGMIPTNLGVVVTPTALGCLTTAGIGTFTAVFDPAWPTTGSFQLQVNDTTGELITCTLGTGTTVNVTARGVAGSAAVIHTAAATVSFDWRVPAAAGAYNANWAAFGSALVAAGVPNTILRIGHQANSPARGWFVGSFASQQANWAAYYRQIVATLDAINTANFSYVFNVMGGVGSISPANFYPGGEFTDAIGVDQMDMTVAPYVGAGGQQWATILNGQGPCGLGAVAAFAVSQGKTMEVGEWGPIVTTANGFGDDPGYVNNMAQLFNGIAPPSWAGGSVPDVAYQSLYNPLVVTTPLATPVVVQKSGGIGSSGITHTSLATTLPAVTTGNTIIAFVNTSGATVTGMAGAGATWTQLYAPTGLGSPIAIWCGTGYATSGTTQTITATFSAATFPAIQAIEVSGLGSGVPAISVAGAVTTGTGTTVTAPTVTPAAINSLLVSWMVGGSAFTGTASSGWTPLGDSANSAGGYLIDATAGPFTLSWTLSASAAWQAVAMAFSPGGGAGVTTVTGANVDNIATFPNSLAAYQAAFAIPNPTTVAPEFTSGPPPIGGVGAPYLYVVTATGSPSITKTGTLPAGLTLSGGTVSGTPTTAGTSSVTFTATNAIGSTTTASLAFVVTASGAVAPAFTASTPPGAVVGTPYAYTFKCSGTFPTFTISSGTLPPWFTLGTNGVLYGTANAPGSFSFDVTATNSAGTTTVALTLAITATTGVIPVYGANLMVTGSSAVGGVLTTTLGSFTGTPNVYTYQWCRNAVPIAGASGVAAAGVAITYTVGTADVGTVITSTVTAGNATGTSPAAISNPIIVPGTAAVGGVPVFVAQSPPAAPLGDPYAYQFAATGGISSWSISSGSPPPGLTLNPVSGLLSGVPTAPGGTFTFVVLASNSFGSTASNSLAISATETAPVVVTPPAINDLSPVVGETINVTAIPGTWS